MTSIQLQVKVVPGSSRDGITGWLGDMLQVRVTVPPERGKTSPRKIVEIQDLCESEVYRRLSTGAA